LATFSFMALLECISVRVYLFVSCEYYNSAVHCTRWLEMADAMKIRSPIQLSA